MSYSKMSYKVWMYTEHVQSLQLIENPTNTDTTTDNCIEALDTSKYLLKLDCSTSSLDIERDFIHCQQARLDINCQASNGLQGNTTTKEHSTLTLFPFPFNCKRPLMFKYGMLEELLPGKMLTDETIDCIISIFKNYVMSSRAAQCCYFFPSLFMGEFLRKKENRDFFR